MFLFTFHYVSILIVLIDLKIEHRSLFTFHYVSILIIDRMYFFVPARLFTFHYVSILILPEQVQSFRRSNLHSIMSLF